MEEDFALDYDQPTGISSKFNDFENSEMLKHTLKKAGIGDSSGNQSERGEQEQRSKGQGQEGQQQRSRGHENIVPDTTSVVLPQRFVVKYLGVRETTNLWGVKHTRGPVDEMVSDAKRKLSTTSGTLPLLTLEVTDDGVTVGPMPQNVNPNFPQGRFPIESISYGVQDLVFTRVFAMIVVRPTGGDPTPSASTLPNTDTTAPVKLSQNSPPFRCHAFVTDKRETAKNLTFALSAAFQKFSQKVSSGKVKPNPISIDLRPGHDGVNEEMDSEA